ncbi:putative sugar efflux transporter [Deinococcus aetherius]|uniref:Sugar efflux transporter n=1 Tax=Deinococcus aetherius TaxID=200252 RepID=A0ABM8AC44_9DEIO|nr:sugar efflux transporter [Deinococcus aetherius]BDP41354.1 putative sugar efflux transporter [Deinococcus aetherius]
MSDAPSPALAAAWRLPHAPGLALTVLLIGLAQSLAAPFLPLFAVNRLQLTPLQLGVFLTLTAVSSVLISTRLARLSDRLSDRRPVLLLALAASALGYAGLSVTRAYPGLLLVGATLLATGAAAFPQVFSLARAQFAAAPGTLPDRAVTALRSVFALAWVVGPGLGAFALARLDFGGLFLLTAGCLALAALPVLQVRATRPVAMNAVTTEAAQDERPRRPLAPVAVAFVLYGMSMSMGMTMFPLLVTRELGGTDGQVGFLVGFCALLEIPFMLAFVAARRLPSTERLVKWAMGLFVLHFALLFLAQGMPLLIVTQAVRAAVLAVLAGLGMAYFQELMPGRFGVATTLYSNTMNIGSMFAGIVSGAWAQLFGYRAVFLLCAGLTLGAWVVMQAITRSRAVSRRKVEAPL